MPNPDIGTCPCPLCREPASVRIYNSRGGKKNGYYLYCPPHLDADGQPAGCGMIQPNLAGGQRYIERNMVLKSAAPVAPSKGLGQVPDPLKVAEAVEVADRVALVPDPVEAVEAVEAVEVVEVVEESADELGVWGSD